MEETLNSQLSQAMAELNEEKVLAVTAQMLKEKYPSRQIIDTVNQGIKEVGTLFENGEYFIADLMFSGLLYREVLSMIPIIPEEQAPKTDGLILMGVVQNDIHDIGKDIVRNILRAEGYRVQDLGVDISPEAFAQAVRTYKPRILLLSGLLSSSRISMKFTIDRLNAEGLRDGIKILLGGGCVTPVLDRELGADAAAMTSDATVRFCRRVLETDAAFQK